VLYFRVNVADTGMFIIQNAADPWSFGWTQLFTIIGFVITSVVAVGGFRTFDRWRREKIEETKIETAFDFLAIAYESKYVFEAIRSPLTFDYESKDMPKFPGESDSEYKRREPFFAILKRIELHNEFFGRFFKLQPRCMAILGKDTGDLFFLAHKARRQIEVSAQMLCADQKYPSELVERMRRDVFDHKEFQPEKDEVGKMLREFQQGVEVACRPIVNKTYGKRLRPNPAEKSAT
jgi:hypothetical protein